MHVNLARPLRDGDSYILRPEDSSKTSLTTGREAYKKGRNMCCLTSVQEMILLIDKSSRTSQSRGWRLYDAKPLWFPPSTTQISTPLGNLSTAFCISCFPAEDSSSERSSTGAGAQRNAAVFFQTAPICMRYNARHLKLSKRRQCRAKRPRAWELTYTERQKNTSHGSGSSTRSPNTSTSMWTTTTRKNLAQQCGTKRRNVLIIPSKIGTSEHHLSTLGGAGGQALHTDVDAYRHLFNTRDSGCAKRNTSTSFRFHRPSCTVGGYYCCTFSGVKGSREPLMTSDGNSWFASFPVVLPPPPMYTTPLTHSGLASEN